MPPTDQILRLFPGDGKGKSWLHFQSELRAEMGLAPGRVVWRSKEQIVDAAVREALRIRRSPSDQWVKGVTRHGNPTWHRTLDDNGALALHGVHKLSRERRMPSQVTIEKHLAGEGRTGYQNLQIVVTARLRQMEQEGTLPPMVWSPASTQMAVTTRPTTNSLQL